MLLPIAGWALWQTGMGVMLLLGMDVKWFALTGVLVPFSLFLMHREAGIFDFRSISIPGLWYWTYLLFVLVPSLAAYRIEAGNHPDRFMASVLSALLTVPLGIVIGNIACRSRAGTVKAYYERPIQISPADFRSFGVLMVLGVCIILAVNHVREVSTVPLVYMIQNPGAAAQMNALREDSLKELDSNFAYVYDVLAKVFFPLLVMITGMRFMFVKTNVNRAMAIGTFICALLYCAMTLEKSPVGLAILCLAIAAYFKRRGRLTKAAILIPIALFAFPLIVFLFQTSNTAKSTQQNLFAAIGGRLFYGGAQVLFYYFDLVPDVLPYQNGATIGKFAMIMGMQPSKIANYVGLRIDPTLPKTVTANAAFLGTLYVDFGMTGVVLGSILTGIIMAVVQQYIIRRPKTLMSFCIYGFVMIKMTLLNIAALPYVLMSGGILIAIVPLVAGDLLGTRQRRRAGFGRQRSLNTARRTVIERSLRQPL
jgi:oligosaccharide repeat unit polymerase